MFVYIGRFEAGYIRYNEEKIEEIRIFIYVRLFREQSAKYVSV